MSQYPGIKPYYMSEQGEAPFRDVRMQTFWCLHAQILHPQESVNKRQRLNMSVNWVRGTDVKYSSSGQW